MEKITLDDHIGMLLLAWLPSTLIVFDIFYSHKKRRLLHGYSLWYFVGYCYLDY